MEDLFDVKKMEKSIGKAKRRSTWKTVFISISAFFVLYIGGLTLNSFITPLLASPIQDGFVHYNNIHGANEFVGVEEFYPGILGGENRYKTYKWIEGKIIYTGDGSYGYGILRDEASGRAGARSLVSPMDTKIMPNHNELGQRIMFFFYPQLTYDDTSNDLQFLDEISNDKLVEMALSFDKGYSSSEAMALIPKGISKTWLWVNHEFDETQLYTHHYNENLELEKKTPITKRADSAFGYSVINTDGTFVENPAERFIGAISSGTKRKSYWQDTFKMLNQNISGDDNKLSVSDLVINGMVVTGTAENLKQLQGLPFIKASSLGIVVDKY